MKLRQKLSIAFVSLVVVFFALALWRAWERIRTVEVQDWSMILLSTIGLAAMILLFCPLWQWALHMLSGKWLPTRPALGIHALSWMGRYLPGKAGTVLGKMHFARSYGFSLRQLGLASIYDQVAQVLGGILFGVLALGAVLISTQRAYWIGSMALLALIIILLQPPIFSRILNIGLRLLKKGAVTNDQLLPMGRLALLTGAYAIVEGAMGLTFALFVHGFGLQGNWLYYAGAMIFSGVAASLAIVFPAGVGVREGLLVVLLAQTMPYELALVIALASRLWTILADIFVIAIIPFSGIGKELRSGWRSRN